MRWLFELIVTILVAMAARAIFGSVMKGFASSARAGFEQRSNTAQQAPQPDPEPAKARERVVIAGEMHKDPVCGMYVSEGTQYQRRLGRDNFYYCSEECKSKHAVTAKA